MGRRCIFLPLRSWFCSPFGFGRMIIIIIRCWMDGRELEPFPMDEFSCCTRIRSKYTRLDGVCVGSEVSIDVPPSTAAGTYDNPSTCRSNTCCS